MRKILLAAASITFIGMMILEFSLSDESEYKICLGVQGHFEHLFQSDQ
ncbi:hypothetical protein ACTHOQ_05675 [Solibacillus silvestris]